MPNSVIIGRLRIVEGNTIILGGNCRIHIPATLSVAEFPLGTSLTIVVYQESDERLIAESITRTPEDRRG